MNVIAKSVVAASIVPTTAVAEIRTDDHQLIALCDDFHAVDRQLETLDDEHTEAWDRFTAIRPAKPNTLRWFMLVPEGVGYTQESVGNGKYRLWCDFTDLERLRDHKYMRCEFVGTKRQWKVLGDDAANMTPEKAAGDPLWRIVPDERDQQILNKLVQEMDAYLALSREAHQASGLTDASNAFEKALEAISDLAHKIASTPARTLAGVQAKAHIVFKNFRNDRREVEDLSGWAQDILSSIVSDLAAMKYMPITTIEA
jgi:hypothetical protein